MAGFLMDGFTRFMARFSGEPEGAEGRRMLSSYQTGVKRNSLKRRISIHARALPLLQAAGTIEAERRRKCKENQMRCG
jgi:hypothetical protein